MKQCVLSLWTGSRFWERVKKLLSLSPVPPSTEGPFTGYVSFLKLCCSSPSPPYSKLKLEKNSGYTYPTLFVGWGEGLGAVWIGKHPRKLMQKCPKAFIHDFRIVCLVFQIPDCPTIPILLGSSQFCLKIPNPDQYSVGTGKILIVTSVVVNKPEQLPQTVLNWNWYPENLNIPPEILKNLLLVWENMQIKIGIKITFNLANILERNQPLNTRTTFQSIKISKFLG